MTGAIADNVMGIFLVILVDVIILIRISISLIFHVLGLIDRDQQVIGILHAIHRLQFMQRCAATRHQ